MLGRIRQVEICKKKKKELVIYGADKVENLLNTENMESNMLSFSKESSKLKNLHIDGADFFAKCKG